MIKSELVRIIAGRNPHLYIRDVDRVVDTILESIVGALEEGVRVELRGFGVFAVKHKRSRAGVDPRTRESVEVVAKAVPFFTAGKILRGRLNGG